MVAWVLRRLVVFGVVFVAFGVLEWALELRAEQPRWRRGFGTDALHFAFTHLLVQAGVFLLGAPLALVIYLVTPPGWRAAVQGLPGLAQLALALVLSDFLGYWWHRLAHSNRFLWRLHSVHHSSEQLDWLASVRLHPLDQVLGRLARFLPLFALGFTPLHYAGLQGLLRGLGLLFHANVDLDWWRPLRPWLASPRFHHWHHAQDPIDRNFSGLFPIWDRLFGTLHHPDGESPASYGVRQPVPEGYLAQLLHPFRRRPRPAEPAEPAPARGYDAAPWTAPPTSPPPSGLASRA